MSAMSSNQDCTGTWQGTRVVSLRAAAPPALSLPWRTPTTLTPAPTPANPSNPYRVLRVEDVGGRRVVQDEGFSQVPPKAAEVLDVAALVEDTGLTEEAGPEDAAAVQQVRDRVGVLDRETRGLGVDVVQTWEWLQHAYGRCRHPSQTFLPGQRPATLARLAVKRTHSKSSPIRLRNSST